jgi:hypothetical protein
MLHAEHWQVCATEVDVPFPSGEKMPIQERRQELHQIKNAPDGPNKIFEIYNRLLAREGIVGAPGLMNNGQIEAILRIEFPGEHPNRHD